MDLQEQHEAWKALVYNWPGAPKYHGTTCQQHQSDLDRYAEVIAELKPPWLIQTGVYWGGTSAFLADKLSEVSPNSRCLFVDINLGLCQIRQEDVPNARFVQGSATDLSFYDLFTDFTNGERGLVSLDDDHTCEQVAAELKLYAQWADYLVVEDTILDTAVGTIYHPSNPKQALDAWLPHHPEFTVDPDPEPTQHVGGWLRRTS